MSNGIYLIYLELEEPSNFHRLVYETVGGYDLSAMNRSVIHYPGCVKLNNEVRHCQSSVQHPATRISEDLSPIYIGDSAECFIWKLTPNPSHFHISK